MSLYLSPRLIELIGVRGSLAEVTSYYLAKSGSAFVFALLIISFAFGKGLLSKFLSSRPFVVLGEVSFALYIVHMSVLGWYVQRQAFFFQLHPSFRLGIYWLLCLLFAYLMHKGIEEPMRKLLLGKRFNKKRLGTILAHRSSQSFLLLVLLLVLSRIDFFT